MKQECSQEQFEYYVSKIAKGELSRRKVCELMRVGPRTLDSKIAKLSETKPELYAEFMKNCQYRAKERTDIDFEALVIYMLKNDLTCEQAVDKFGVSKRTITRHIHAMEKTNPELVKIYREYSHNNSILHSNSRELERRISELLQRPVVLSDRIEDRIAKLEENINLGNTSNRSRDAKELETLRKQKSYLDGIKVGTVKKGNNTIKPIQNKKQTEGPEQE